MIPVRLSLSNFMCYRDNVPPIHFGGIHIASISGNNGNGKSALIDAMTWALWGKTRARRDDDLVHTGQAETAVEFDFAIGDQVYRILRRHSRPKRRAASGQTILELQIATEDGFRPISGNTIPQTQQKIIDTLHMDYDTFTNSAFLRQGHADEFTTANPAQRKQVLASILGLSLYDDLEAQARELARSRETEKRQLETTIRDIDEELAHKPAYQAEMAAAEAELARLAALLKSQDAGLGDLRRRQESLETRRRQLAQLKDHIEQRSRTLGQWSALLTQQQARLREHEGLLAQRDSIETGYARLVEARRLNDELDRRFRQSVGLDRQRAELEVKISQASQAVLQEHAVAQQRIAELDFRSARLPDLRDDLRQAQHQLQHLEEEDNVLTERRQAEQQLRAGLHGLETNRSRLHQEIRELGEKLDLLLTDHGATCPLCETELGAEGLQRIEQKYSLEKQQRSQSLEEAESGLTAGRRDLKAADEEIARIESRLKQDRATLQGKISLLTQQATDAETAGRQLGEERDRLAQIEERLARRDFAAPHQALLESVEQELAALGYDAEQHDRVRQDLASLEPHEEPKQRLDEAERLIDEERSAVAHAGEAIAELRLGLDADARQQHQLTEEISGLADVADELAAAETEYRNLTEQQQRAQQAVGNVRGKLQRCAELELRRRERSGTLTHTAEEEGIYRDLAEAFGKKGVQALLIETSLPEIEAEANRLLGRMTDHRMNVKIETQRETRKGDTIETLDINIADELGTRNYEMFSGGEAFRINFAIRIALSRLLTRRAGAPLPTLIIDEGFGTQDSIGIEKLKEAINSVQDDFKMILVITHIEELRDAFPTRIDVTKGPDGATLSFN